MNKLIILTGDTGCGKTHLLKLLNYNCSNDIVVIKKYSDRDMRLGEENAIEIKAGCKTEDVEAMDYVYTGKNNKKYGFPKKDVDSGLQQGKSPIVIVDDEEQIIRLCRDYKGRVCPVYMERDVSDLDFMEELRKDGRTENQIRERMESRYKSQDIWRRNANLFGYRYIINGLFMDDEKLLEWFQLIAEENNVDIEETKKKSSVRGLVNYFRSIWKRKPHISEAKIGSEPVLDDYQEIGR